MALFELMPMYGGLKVSVNLLSMKMQLSEHVMPLMPWRQLVGIVGLHLQHDLLLEVLLQQEHLHRHGQVIGNKRSGKAVWCGHTEGVSRRA